MDCALDCAVSGETVVAGRPNRGEQVEGDDFLVTGRGDPACGPYYAPHGKWKNLDDLSVMHSIMTFQWHLGPQTTVYLKSHTTEDYGYECWHLKSYQQHMIFQKIILISANTIC